MVFFTLSWRNKMGTSVKNFGYRLFDKKDYADDETKNMTLQQKSDLIQSMRGL